MKTIYLSSTLKDLLAHRVAVRKALGQMQYHVRSMEDDVARDRMVVEQCLTDVGECDVYVGIFALRYGYVPEQQNPDGLSITELEYRAAEGRKPCLIFLLDPEEEANWPDRFKDEETGENESGGRIQALRRELEHRMRSYFRTPDDLAQAVMAAVHLAEADVRRRALSQELGHASSLTMGSSRIPEVLGKIARAITDEAEARVLIVSLGDGDRWWSTRLLLLAGLCMEYTSVSRFVIEGTDRRFVGSIEPRDVRRALSQAFPDVETAYRASLPAANDRAFDPIDELNVIIQRFSYELDFLGGETIVKRWIRPHAVSQWGGLERGSVELGDDPVSPRLISRIVGEPSPLVVLTRHGRVERVVDREALAVRAVLAMG